MTDPALPLNAWLRWDLIRRRLRELEPLSQVLEVGAGLGAVGTRLARVAAYIGVEPDETSRRRASSRLPAGSRMVRHLDDLDPSVTFDMVCAFEVLEHIEDDAAALAAWAARVRPGGHLLLSMPAHQRRFGAWDDRVGHLRRYERTDLVQLLRNASLEPVSIASWGFPLGNALERARNLIARIERGRSDSVGNRTAASGRTFQPPDWFATVTRSLSWPFRLMQRPFQQTALGTGWVVVARRSTT